MPNFLVSSPATGVAGRAGPTALAPYALACGALEPSQRRSRARRALGYFHHGGLIRRQIYVIPSERTILAALETTSTRTVNTLYSAGFASDLDARWRVRRTRTEPAAEQDTGS